ncbi:hypothetical protein EJ06DRAFT_433324 [Trichodelitschia bisporula]|uniref:D-isomer specific 2-hydroxyacid dehydrogenase NAD-binding domain-containing protein n=1 Tax=Trichodelitschia bisporula TaxID=703511 RepID=A0A6G1HWT8_9PEZI|nr:hypothetical protein EJ06DRAFT_433324 [Trichodelitschia bisporula]
MGSKAEHLVILLPWPEPTELLDKLKEKFPGLTIAYYEIAGWANTDGQATGKHIKPIPADVYKDATIIATTSLFPDTREEAPHLELVHVFSAGADRVIVSPLFKDTHVVFTNSSGVHGPQIAEWSILAALVHNHHYNLAYDRQKERKWSRSNLLSVRDWAGQRLGVLGYGSIGRQAGRVAKAMGMDVIAYTASPRATPESRRDDGYIVPGTGDPDGSIPSAWYSGTDKESLHTFLAADIDILLVGVPHTPATDKFLSGPEFDILAKRNAFLINIARGGVIDQPELIRALEDGRLRGAGLDVTTPEPLPEDDPLWDAPNVIISPHVSGASEAYLERGLGVLEANLERRRRGQGLINVIERGKGY